MRKIIKASTLALALLTAGPALADCFESCRMPCWRDCQRQYGENSPLGAACLTGCGNACNLMCENGGIG